MQKQSGTTRPEVNTSGDALLLRRVTVVDTHDGTLAREMTVVIENGKIVNVASSDSIGPSSAAMSIDAHGKFVVPGYLDLHAHPLNSANAEGGLRMMLANGITGFRQMAGTPELLGKRRQGTLMPPADAPELLEMAGEILTVPTPAQWKPRSSRFRSKELRAPTLSR